MFTIVNYGQADNRVMVKAPGLCFDFGMLVFKAERGRGGRERVLKFCSALLLRGHRWTTRDRVGLFSMREKNDMRGKE